MIPFMSNVQNRQIHRDTKWISGYQGLREEELGVTTNRYGVSFWGNGMFRNWIMVTIAHFYKYTRNN